MVDPLRDLLAADGFRAGFAFGLVAAAVAGLGGLLVRRRVPLAGVAFGAATVLAFDERFGVEADLVAGLGALAAGGYLTGRWHPAVRLPALVPGAVLVERSIEVGAPGWAVAGFLVVTVLGGAQLAEFDRAWAGCGLGPLLLAPAALGVYGTTPETQHSVILLGAALPVALLGWPLRPLASLGAGGAPVAAALVAWAALVDGMHRPGAVVGALACLGVMVIEPALRWLGLWGRRLGRGGAEPCRPATRLGLVAGVHLAVVGVCSRVAGLQTAPRPALAIAVAAYAAAAAVLAIAARADGQRT